MDRSKYLVYEQEPAYATYAFSSPSGGIRCTISQFEDSSPWGCYVLKHRWRDPKLPLYWGDTCATSGRLKGAVYAMGYDSGFTRLCKGVLPGITKKSRVLPRNTRITFNGITCTSTRWKKREAIRCSAPKKVGFTVSRTRLALAQPKR
ncbi:hypothetical protein [Amnibacterium setariae]|uniref:hypothetical protein n=1 Tax=Amnibacterium setariae TaxID=2306585 RepID=UPI0011C34EC3|nr:hypothetical protein [Amnibacterium setariae]